MPLRSYLLYGYLTGEAPLIVTVLLPCAILAFAATVHEAPSLWFEGPHQDVVVLVGMTTFGLLLAGAAANAVWSGMASCYECTAWFFFFAIPAFLLEFLTGAIWILLVHGSLHRVSTPVRSR